MRWKGKLFAYFKHYNQLIFEGEYIEGKINGKVKEYYDDGTIKFEGEYLNGNRWNGKVLISNYEAEIKKGKERGSLKISSKW